MRALLLLAAAATLPAGGADRFEAFAARFPRAVSPLPVDFEGGTRLEPREAIEQVLSPASRLPAEGPGAALRERWATPARQERTRHLLQGAADPGESLELFALWRREQPVEGKPPFQLLAVAVQEAFPAGSSTEAWLLAFRAGTLLDAALLGTRGAGEAGTVADEVTVSDGGAFVGQRRQLVPLHDVPGAEQLEVRSTRAGRFDPGRARFTLSPEDFEARGGRYLDRRSGEVLLVLDGPGQLARVLYQARASGPRQELAVEDHAGVLTVRFARSPRPYRLSFDDLQASLTCENPDGTRQRFERAW